MNDTLDLDQLESGQVKLMVRPVDLNVILVETAASFSSHAATHPIDLDLADGLPKLVADSDRLTQVCTNLVSNAIKYSPDGGNIELRTKHENGAEVLTVRDHGIGIPADQLEKIFERYSRIETAHNIQGTGLGLPIVRQIVHLFDGKVWVASSSGEAPSFTCNYRCRPRALLY